MHEFVIENLIGSITLWRGEQEKKFWLQSFFSGREKMRFSTMHNEIRHKKESQLIWRFVMFLQCVCFSFLLFFCWVLLIFCSRFFWGAVVNNWHKSGIICLNRSKSVKMLKLLNISEFYKFCECFKTIQMFLISTV